MKPDFSGFVDDGMITLDNVTDCVGGEGLGEGAQVMKRNGWYCIVNICWLALGRGGTQVVLDYTNPAVRDGAKYDISEINGAPSHGARLDGRNLKLAFSGSYDSAVFELKTCE